MAHDLLTSQQVAEAFNVTVASVGRWARDGVIPSFRTPGGNLRFRRRDIEAFFDGSPPDEPHAAATPDAAATA